MSLVPILDRYKLDGGALDEASAVRDLLTDVIHYCRAHDVHFLRACRAAVDIAQEEEMLKDQSPYPTLGANNG